ncbi:nucleotidyltransferase domain-containing protein [Inquilinus limosus]|uniref:DNA polymerase beta superfamily protein n=1 Tax=Inquilinus limosus TaxID=171674 RepID=UPI003F141943
MRILVEMRCGSHLYGTATPESDVDLKAVYLPTARDLLLQRTRPTIVDTRPKAHGERNQPGDVDREVFSLQRYLDLLIGGQPAAIEMLFAPDSVMTAPPDGIWREIQAAAPRLVSRRAASFVRYCRQQANKYGIKGSRAATARQALAVLEAAEWAHGAGARLDRAEPMLEALAAETEFVAVVDIEVQPGRMARHLDICGRKAPFHAAIRTARELAARLVAEYGQRALEAERQQGVDWKALSHAVRVGHEALELFATGRLRFPLATADHLLRIKRGEIPYAAVAGEIERLMGQAEEAAVVSVLPAAPDMALVEAIILEAHRRQILEDGA